MTDRIPEGTSWEDVEQRSYDPQLNQLTIVSKDHSKRIFDMKTGEILVGIIPLGGFIRLWSLFLRWGFLPKGHAHQQGCRGRFLQSGKSNRPVLGKEAVPSFYD